jgi:SsrA-binding protein
MPVLAVNRKATFDYEILETYEAGIELKGFEVKSAKAGRANLAGSFVVVRGGEAFLLGATIAPYQPKNTPAGHEPSRTRRLLLHRAELKELIGATAQKHLTLIPLRMYNKGPKIKLEVGLARRRKKYDKREHIREREDQRKIERALKSS